MPCSLDSVLGRKDNTSKGPEGHCDGQSRGAELFLQCRHRHGVRAAGSVPTKEGFQSRSLTSGLAFTWSLALTGSHSSRGGACHEHRILLGL